MDVSVDAALGGSLEICHVPIEQAERLAGQIPTPVQHFSGYHALVGGRDKMIQYFMTGSPCVTAKLGVVKMVKATITLGDVGCCGSRGPEKLIAHAIPLFLRKFREDVAGDEQA